MKFSKITLKLKNSKVMRSLIEIRSLFDNAFLAISYRSFHTERASLLPPTICDFASVNVENWLTPLRDAYVEFWQRNRIVFVEIPDRKCWNLGSYAMLYRFVFSVIISIVFTVISLRICCDFASYSLWFHFVFGVISPRIRCHFTSYTYAVTSHRMHWQFHNFCKRHIF